MKVKSCVLLLCRLDISCQHQLLGCDPRQLLNAVSSDNSHFEVGQVDDQSLLDFCHTFLHQFICFVLIEILVMAMVHDGESEVASVAVRGLGHLDGGGEVVNEVQCRPFLFVPAAQQHVHVVGRPAAQCIGQISSREVGGRRRSHLIAIAHFVKLNVLCNVFSKLGGVSFLSNYGHHQVFRDLMDFILIIFDNHNTLSICLICSDHNKISKLNSYQALHFCKMLK